MIFLQSIIFIMPGHCCVTGCRSNYAATKNQQCEIVSVFKFPSDPVLRAQWIKKISRENLKVNKRTVVCEKHFASQHIVRVDTVIRPDGTILSMPRKHVKLTKGAIPTYFLKTPAYLSSEPLKRRSPGGGKVQKMVRDEAVFDEWLSQDETSDYSERSNAIDGYIQNNNYLVTWKVINSDNFIFVHIIDVDDVLRLRINRALCVEVLKGGFQLSKSSLSRVIVIERINWHYYYIIERINWHYYYIIERINWYYYYIIERINWHYYYIIGMLVSVRYLALSF